MHKTSGFDRQPDSRYHTDVEFVDYMLAARILEREPERLERASRKHKKYKAICDEERFPFFYHIATFRTPVYTSFEIMAENCIVSGTTNNTKETPRKKRAKDILRDSGKFKLFKANNLFNLKEIDQSMTLDEFKKLRKKEYLPIEDYLLKERYE